MKRWRYFSVMTRHDADQAAADKFLTEYGLGGWELVGVVSAGANYNRFFFKRPADDQVLPAESRHS